MTLISCPTLTHSENRASPTPLFTRAGQGLAYSLAHPSLAHTSFSCDAVLHAMHMAPEQIHFYIPMHLCQGRAARHDAGAPGVEGRADKALKLLLAAVCVCMCVCLRLDSSASISISYVYIPMCTFAHKQKHMHACTRACACVHTHGDAAARM